MLKLKRILNHLKRDCVIFFARRSTQSTESPLPVTWQDSLDELQALLA
jgi:hypothetical protein